MKEIILTIILGIIQGLTEFLPVSSSGHITLFQDIFNITQNNLFTAVALHFGTLLAVVVYYFKDLVGLIKKENHKKLLLIVIATIPSGIVMLALNNTVNNLFVSSKFLWIGFLITALVLLAVDAIGKRIKNPKPITTKTALLMGLAQACAIFPGVSRSGSTIAGGIILAEGERKQIADFAFLMSVPVIAGSTLFEAITVDYTNINITATILGVLAAFITGYFAIKFMIRLISRCNFKWFSLYLFVITLLTFINGIIVPLW